MENKQYSFSKKTIVGYTLFVAGVTALICCLVFFLLGYRFFLKDNVEVKPEQTPTPQVTQELPSNGGASKPQATNEIEPEQTQKPQNTKTSTISIPGFEVWNIDAGKTKVSANFYNPNQNGCYFVLSVVLDDTGEKIYESKYLKPGQHLYEVELLRALRAGEYKATLHYSTYSLTDRTPLNGADVPFKLVVK